MNRLRRPRWLEHGVTSDGFLEACVFLLIVVLVLVALSGLVGA
jgi:hypothetical protein